MGKFCGKCGSEIDEKTGVCPKCNKKKSNKLLIALIIAIVCAFIVIAVFATVVLVDVFSKDNNTDETVAVTVAQTDAPTQTQTEQETEKEVETVAETQASKFVRNDTVYYSRDIQKYNGDVYYCSSDRTDGTVGLKILDFSKTDLGYKKIPVEAEGGVQSFVIYEDYIYYVCNYRVDTRIDYGLYNSGSIYRCDMDGKNTTLVCNDTCDDSFEIVNGKVYFSIFKADSTGNMYAYGSYDIDTQEVAESVVYEVDDSTRPPRLFSEQYPEYVEFDGGYYYCIIDNDITEVDGNIVNVILQREDKETGKIEEVGYGYSQTGGTL